MVATTAVHTFVGLITGGPAGAIVAGSMAFVASVLDIVFNDKCHFATRCEDGHVENCTTGECIVDPEWPPTGGGHFADDVVEKNKPGSFRGLSLKIFKDGCKSECCDFISGRIGHIYTKNARIPSCEADAYLKNIHSLDVYPFSEKTSQSFPYSLEGAVDMAEADVRAKYSKHQYTVLGFPRNKDYFWSVYTDPHGALSARNKQIIAKKEGSPTVDDQWKLKMPGQKYAEIGDVIEHHHVLQGRWAIPIARKLHRGGIYYSMMHPRYTDSDAFISNEEASIRAAKTIYGRFTPGAKEVLESAYDDDPLALLNNIYALGSDDKVLGLPIKRFFVEGDLYYLVDRDSYLKVNKIYYSSAKKRLQDIYRIDYTNYAGYGYDRYVGEYFGIGVLGRGQLNVGNWGRKGKTDDTSNA